ncbi:MAG: hypothetical protein HBSAPP03_14220 [Phycisphaerae bacterium]|nr:MAG: hypothetical protein HBSAPP03_14220 [Phycisphaerae bacterium]
MNPPTNPADILLAHDRWATGQVLDACARLSVAQLHTRFEIGLGSLHDTLVHVIGAMRLWADVLGLRPPRPWIEQASRRSAAELRVLYDEAAADLAAVAFAGPMDQPLQRERQGVVSTYTRGAVLTHVTTHGMHHRAQCLNMLRHLGVSPLPPSSVVEWSRAGGPV